MTKCPLYNKQARPEKSSRRQLEGVITETMWTEPWEASPGTGNRKDCSALQTLKDNIPLQNDGYMRGRVETCKACGLCANTIIKRS